jgi:polyphosphate kinase
MLDHAFSDEVSAWVLQSDGRWERRTTGPDDVRLSDYQHDLMADAMRRGHR